MKVDATPNETNTMKPIDTQPWRRDVR